MPIQNETGASVQELDAVERIINRMSAAQLQIVHGLTEARRAQIDRATLSTLRVGDRVRVTLQRSRRTRRYGFIPRMFDGTIVGIGARVRVETPGNRYGTWLLPPSALTVVERQSERPVPNTTAVRDTEAETAENATVR